ncbi:hypothetical protein C8Q74DRAFT_942401 [Fomes fomentarius]|nr:hypothetical protein C8Q74DRAFT_942401 [Fomes fomentarius]
MLMPALTLDLPVAAQFAARRIATGYESEERERGGLELERGLRCGIGVSLGAPTNGWTARGRRGLSAAAAFALALLVNVLCSFARVRLRLRRVRSQEHSRPQPARASDQVHAATRRRRPIPLLFLLLTGHVTLPVIVLLTTSHVTSAFRS